MMGYRFQLVSGDFPTSVTRGTNYQGTVSVTNTGVAPLYNQRPVQVLKISDKYIYTLTFHHWLKLDHFKEYFFFKVVNFHSV